MSNIKDTQTAKTGLSALFGTPIKSETAVQTDGGLQRIEDTPKTKEEIIDSLSVETKEALQKEIQRRQYLKAGRPPKGSEKKVGGTIPMTFRITPEKQERLRRVALQEGLFIGEVLDRSIDLYLAKYEKEEEI
jgi:hypothetical protein